MLKVWNRYDFIFLWTRIKRKERGFVCFGFFSPCTCVLAKLLQSCLTLSDPVDWSVSGSSVHGILQARRLEWVAIPSSRVSGTSDGTRDGTCVSYASCRQAGSYPGAKNFIYWLMHCVEADMVGTWRLGPEGLCSTPAAALRTLDDLGWPWGKLLTSLQPVSLSVKSMDREAWHAAIHGVTKSRTRLSNSTELKVNGVIWMLLTDLMVSYYNLFPYEISYLRLGYRPVSPLSCWEVQGDPEIVLPLPWRLISWLCWLLDACSPALFSHSLTLWFAFFIIFLKCSTSHCLPPRNEKQNKTEVVLSKLHQFPSPSSSNWMMCLPICPSSLSWRRLHL